MKPSVSIVVDSRDRPVPLEGLVRSQEAVFLDARGCPICEYCADAEEQFFRWFGIETFADPAMHARLRRSAGFCARHERRALGIDQLSPVPAMGRGAIDQLGDGPPERDECPACASVRQAREHAEGMLRTVLGRRELRERYLAREGGACLPHLAVLIAEGDAQIARMLAEKLHRDLGASEAFELVAGRDTDASLRVALRTALPSSLAADAPTSAEAERAAWQLEACPVCLAGARAERRYLDWRRHEERATAPDLPQDPGLLCAAHLHELLAADVEAGRRAAALVRQRWLQNLSQALKRWPATPRATRRQLRRRQSPAVLPRVSHTFCPACRAKQDAEERHQDLLLRLLAQRPYAVSYEAAHGVCLRHALLIDSGTAGARVRDGLRARLSVVDWEIAEAARKRGWDARHERPGAEQTARLRLAALLDGATFVGGPASPMP